MEQSREYFGDAWLETYLSSPIWCFSASAGCCGERPFCGLLMPSLDRVGRYYPLSIVAPLGARDMPLGITAATTEWFARLEALALSCLGEGFDFVAFDAELAAAPPPVADSAGGVLEIPITEAGPAAVIGTLLGALLETCAIAYSLWWTTGSRKIAACCRAYRGLPPIEGFAKLLG
jgi:type VI secretion system protein ImpM